MSLVTLGQKIRELRQECRLTITRAARLSGIPAPQWSDIEHGRRVPDSLGAIAIVLGCDVEVLKEAAKDNPVGMTLEERVAKCERDIAGIQDGLRRLNQGPRRY